MKYLAHGRILLYSSCSKHSQTPCQITTLSSSHSGALLCVLTHLWGSEQSVIVQHKGFVILVWVFYFFYFFYVKFKTDPGVKDVV